MALATDRIDILLDADGDISLANGDFVYSTGIDAVVQQVKIALQMIRGEWFLDLDEGIPYFENDYVTEAESLIGNKFDEKRARAAFRDVIVAVPGVVALNQLAISFDGTTRRMSVSFAVKTEFGDSATEEVTP